MKLIPDSNSENTYNNLLQYTVNTLVTIVILSVTVTSVKIAYDVLFLGSTIFRSEIPTTPKTPISFCYYSADIDDDYDYVREDRETVTSYATNYRDLGNSAKGIVLTNEMLMAMSEEHNMLNASYGIGGFHLYFANKTSTGSNPSIVFVPIDHDFRELSPNRYRVLDVPAEVSGPCPLLCDEATGDSFYNLY